MPIEGQLNLFIVYISFYVIIHCYNDPFCFAKIFVSSTESNTYSFIFFFTIVFDIMPMFIRICYDVFMTFTLKLHAKFLFKVYFNVSSFNNLSYAMMNPSGLFFCVGINLQINTYIVIEFKK